MTLLTEFSSASECSAVEVQLWSANQRATEAEESPLLRFVTRKHCRGTVIVQSGYHVKTSECRPRRLSVQRFVVSISTIVLYSYL
jgi:hypothetical protein